MDGIVIETQTALEELGLAIEAAREAGAPCIIGSVAFDITRNGRDARTMMGVTPEKAAEFLQTSGANIAATNCGAGVDIQWMEKILTRYRKACDLPLMAKPNAGKPVLEDGRWVYKQSPEEMAAGLEKLLDAGPESWAPVAEARRRTLNFFAPSWIAELLNNILTDMVCDPGNCSGLVYRYTPYSLQVSIIACRFAATALSTVAPVERM